MILRQPIVPICRTHPLAEMEYVVNDSGQEFVIYHSEFRSKIETLLEGRVGIDVAEISKGEKPRKVLSLLHNPVILDSR